ncbi:MAG: restriction endonuclease subunit S [Candidatus Cyclobacteriaceae bacterium M2_1C_046]
MNKYKSYKDSGLSWIGHIPDSWHTVRNKHIFQEISDCRSTGEETLLTVSHITGVTPRSEKNVNMFFAETMAGYKRVKEGDLIINTMWAWMGALGISKEDGICSPAYNVYRNNKGINYCAKYFDYLFRTPNFIKEMTRFSKGIVDSRLRLYPKDFYRIHTCLPSLKEQTTIAYYLDTKTQTIDKKVCLLEKKIGYYQELRKSLINETVTKGLDKNVRLKNSGIAFIRIIPEHWEVKRLKDYFSLFTGNSISDKSSFENPNGSIPYIATKDIEFYTGKITYNNGIYIPIDDKSFKRAKPNSTLICIEGANAGKKIGFTEKSVAFVNKLCAIKSNNLNNCDKYLYYFTQTNLFNSQFFSLINGLIGGVSVNLIKHLNILIPAKDEQVEIVEYLDFRLAQIDKIIANIQTQINTLKELRKTLINDVVTGKIKVIQD